MLKEEETAREKARRYLRSVSLPGPRGVGLGSMTLVRPEEEALQFVPKTSGRGLKQSEDTEGA